jgi:hypothetical protein
MSVRGPLTSGAVLAAFDEHLCRTRGICPAVRHNYARFVLAFLDTVYGDGPVDLTRLCVRDVVEFVSAMTVRVSPCHRPARGDLAAVLLSVSARGGLAR